MMLEILKFWYLFGCIGSVLYIMASVCLNGFDDDTAIVIENEPVLILYICPFIALGGLYIFIETICHILISIKNGYNK